MKKHLLWIVLFAVWILPGLRGVSAAENGVENVKIKITSGATTLLAELNNSPASRDLIAKLPVTLKMSQHENREYYGSIQLAKTGKTQNGYQVGDIAYWTPGNALVLYYAKGYTGSLMIMGRITSGLDKLPLLGSAFTATIERIEE